jgi:hypothetical protein
MAGAARPNSVICHGSNPDRLHAGYSSPVLQESAGVDAYDARMVEWLSWSGMFNEPCYHCGRPRLVHDDETMGHLWVPATFRTNSRQVAMTRAKTIDRERRGDYDAPLPPPSERRRIRVAAGWTQQQVADVLHVSRHAVGRFERQAGLVNGERLSGREPSGEVRVAYSGLLKRLLVDGRHTPDNT